RVRISGRFGLGWTCTAKAWVRHHGRIPTSGAIRGHNRSLIRLAVDLRVSLSTSGNALPPENHRQAVRNRWHAGGHLRPHTSCNKSSGTTTEPRWGVTWALAHLRSRSTSSAPEPAATY